MATQNLSSLVIISPISSAVSVQQLAIFNADKGNSPQNGGACCCFIVPSGVTYLAVELWGAGGDGGGACCCMGPVQTASPGSYVKRYIYGSSLCPYYNVCVGGSGCCSQSCQATNGFPSYIKNPAGTVVGCACGGCGGSTQCHTAIGCTGCTGMRNGPIQGMSSSCADLNILGSRLGSQSTDFCAQFSFMFSGGGIKYQPNTRHSTDVCNSGMAIQGCNKMANSWPGGGGIESTACGGGCCWGSWGASGLVLITYG